MELTKLTYTFSSSISFERLNGEIIIISFDSGDYFSCFGTASDILTLINQRASCDQIIKTLSNYYNETLIKDQVLNFIKRCLTEQIIVESDDKSSMNFSLPDDYDRSKWNEPILEKFSEYNDLLLIDPIHDSSLEGWPNKLDQNKQ